MEGKEKGSDQSREHNKKYLGLDDDQVDRWEKLMTTKMNEWPEGLKKYVEEKKPLSGDQISVAVAEWIKENQE